MSLRKGLLRNRKLFRKDFSRFRALSKTTAYLLKAEVTPVFKEGELTLKTDYRPVSTLSKFSKIFGKLICLKLNNYEQNKFSI